MSENQNLVAAQGQQPQSNSIKIDLTRETGLILNNIRKELLNIYGEKLETMDDVILFLTNYYYKK